MQTQEDQAGATEGKLTDSQATVSLLTLARLGVGVKLAGVCDLHHTAPARPRALHLQETLLTGYSWLTLRLPGSETPLHEASRPGPLSLLNPASALIFCPFASHCPTSPKHPTWLDTGTLPSLLFLLLASHQTPSEPYLIGSGVLIPLSSYCS